MRLENLYDLLQKPIEEVQYVVDGLLPTGGLSLLASDPKTGKSTLVRNMIRSVIHGEPFLGRSTKPVKTVYYVLEEPKLHMLAEMRRLGFATSEASKQVEVWVGPINKSKLKKTIKDLIDKTQAQLIIIDPLFDAIEVEDSNAYVKINRAMKEILGVVRNTDTHILVTHHTNKGEWSGGRSVLGSQALPGSTDCNMFLTKKRNEVRSFKSENRIGEAFESSDLVFDKETRLITLEEENTETKLEGISSKILSVIDTPMLYSELRNKIKGRNTDKKKAFDSLVSLGLIEQKEDKKWVRTTEKVI